MSTIVQLADGTQAHAEELLGRPLDKEIRDFLKRAAQEVHVQHDEWGKSQSGTLDIPEVVIQAPSFALINAIKEKKISLDDIDWKGLEDLVGELLSREGYDVTMGRRSKDGGVDIYAECQHKHLGRFLTIWQAKKLKPKNKVGLSFVRELADVRIEQNASKAFIVTNTYLTRGAIDRINRDCYLLGKVDGKDLYEWVRKKHIEPYITL